MWLGGLLIAIFALLFAGPYFVDWNSYRGVFEEEASRILGRRVRVGGSVNVRLLPAPYLLFEDLRISDTTGIAGAALFKTDSFKMWLAVPPLLNGAFEANKIELQHPVLALAADLEGRGNWRTLLDVKSMPFVPTGVKLDSVLIEDGTISYSIEGGGVLTRVENISGELTAQALAGPYSFRGSAVVGGNKSDLRLVTTKASADGSFRINAQLSGGKRADDHKFDGYVRDLWEMPSVTGQLVSKTRLAHPTTAEGTPLVAEVRAEIVAKGQSLDFNGLSVSFNDFAQPQIITGSMKAVWSRRHLVELVLSSRWLDVDLMSGSLSGSVAQPAPNDDTGAPSTAAPAIAAAPLPTARGLIARLLDVFPDNTDVRARLDVDQVNLGGDRVGGLVVAMERAGGPLKLQTLRAILPGGARLNFSGFVEVIEGDPVFDGDLFIGGVSAEKIIRWAIGSDDAESLISDGPFSVSGRMQLGSNRVMLKSAVAEFSGVPIRGGMVWDDGQKSVDLEVEGYEIDTRWFGLGRLEMPALAELLAASGKASDGDGADEPGAHKRGVADWIVGLGRDLNLDVSAGRLTDGTTTLGNVEARLKVSGARVDIERLKLVTEDGLSARVSGSLDGIGEAPKGSVDYLISADDQAAAWKIADLWAGRAAAPADRDRFAAFAPIRVAGRGDFGMRMASAADFTFDGTAGGGRVAGQLMLDGGVGNWRGAPVDLLVRSQAADTGQLFAGLSGGRLASASGREADAGDLLLKVDGVPGSRLLTMITFDSPRVSLVFDGNTEIGAEGLSSLSGELQLRDGDIRKLLRLSGLNVPGGLGALSYDGLADVEWTPERIAITPRDVNLSGARVGGRIVLKSSDDGQRKIEGRLNSDTGSLPRILSALLSEPDTKVEPVQVARVEPAIEGAGEAAALSDGSAGEQPSQVFADRPFELSVLEGVEGGIEFSAGGLDIGAGMAVAGATGTLRASNGKLSLEFAGKQPIGGTLKATLEVTKAAAGAVGRGSLEISNAKLAALPVSPAAGAAAGSFGSGRAGLKVNFEGAGLSPRSMITVMTGKGLLKLEEASLTGLAPDGIRDAAEATLTAEDFSTDDLKARLAAVIGSGQIPVGNRELEISVADGAVQVAALDVQQDGGQTRVLGTFDLRSFVFDSEWRVVADYPEAGRPWPPVVVTKVGALQKLGAIDARLTTDALERELAVRKMERNVQELERLRRLDEEAAAKQRERELQLELESQRIEQERAAAAAAARLNGLELEKPPAPLPDGWSAKPKPEPEGGAALSPQGGGAAGGPASAAGAEGGAVSEAAQAPAAVPDNKRVRRKTRRKPKPKPNLPTQIFGF